LIELLLVILIVGLVSALYWGGLSGKSGKSKMAECQQNLQKLYLSLQIYANDHANQFPITVGALSSEQALAPLVPKYTADTSLFICPGTGDASPSSTEPLSKQHIDYAYYMGQPPGNTEAVLMSDAQVNSLSKNPGQPVFSRNGKPPGNNHKKDGGNYLFCDGHADSALSGASSSLILTQGVVLLNPSPR